MPLPQIPLSQPDITQREIDAVVDVLNTPTLSIGPKVEEFEYLLARLTGRRHAVAVSSGTAGLHCCMIAAGLEPGKPYILAFAAHADGSGELEPLTKFMAARSSPVPPLTRSPYFWVRSGTNTIW